MHGAEDRWSLSLYIMQVRNYYKIVCYSYLASGDEIVTLIKIWLDCHTIWEDYSSQHGDKGVDVHSACTASLKWFCDGLPSGWCTWCGNCHIDQKYEILHLDCRAIRKENTQLFLIAYSGYTVSLFCKFEINQRFCAIWLVVIKLPRQSKYEFLH